MSTQSKYRQHARRLVDRAIRSTYEQFGPCTRARAAFDVLLAQARACSTLLHIRGDASEQLLAVEALRNIARHAREFVEWPSTWPGGDGDVYTLIHDFACHVFGHYPVPQQFVFVWFGDATRTEASEREWFIEHARGCRFRAIPCLPMAMTRKMERLLLTSPGPMRLRPAMRRAEILALGGAPELVDAVLATSLATDLEHGEFWRSAMHFFVRYWDELGTERVRSIIDMLYDLRIRPQTVQTDAGAQIVPPPEPEFCLAGRTPASLLQRLHAHKYRATSAPAITWPSLGLPEFIHRDELGEWHMVELLDTRALSVEGKSMHNCVRSYRWSCVAKQASIWSLRKAHVDGPFESNCTIQVHPTERAIVQIRGICNKRVDGHLRATVERWAEQVSLTIAPHAW